MKNAMAVSAPAVEAPLVRIVIADDHLIARVGLVTIVNEQHDMTVVAEATNGQQAVALYQRLRPDVILMDLRMPVMDGFDAARAIRAEFLDARILALSTYSADEYIHRAFTAGVQAYLKKDVQHDDLIQTIRAVHSGQAPIAASLVAQSPRPDLSARELEVLRLIAQGLSNKQIGYALSIAEYTVMNHVKSILGKLGADDRTQAATVAIHRGIIHLQD
jgi:two-component system, NarL family, response regulator